ncbi:hypothetical protein, partial [Neisseria bacilliformis]|uniref:hypothetical protein n=1 Tax=Neisseria bacilliformis TaxID=267212 RepID=UPI00195541F3
MHYSPKPKGRLKAQLRRSQNRKGSLKNTNADYPTPSPAPCAGEGRGGGGGSPNRLAAAPQ